MDFKKISVVIPVALDTDCRVTLNSLKNVDYPKNKIEIFVIRGNRPCLQRNLAVKQAKGELILFLDNDCIFKKDFVRRIVKHFEDPKVTVVGGPSLPASGNTFIQRCFSSVMGSYFAMSSMNAKFKSVGKVRQATEKEMILCNMCMRKDVFDAVGGFNEELYPSEECELMNRIKGNKIIYDPDIKVYRHPRDSIPKFTRQFFNYGWGRTRHFIINPRFIIPVFLMPSLFAMYLISLIFFHPLWFTIPLLVYIFLDIISSLLLYKESKELKALPIMFFLFPLLHLAYGVGVICGISKRFDPKLKYKKTYVKLKKKKSFFRVIK